jgi:CubicO group peptidase (beta-lactamase class C family)
MAAYGLFSTVGDMARIARLLQDRGRADGVQILSATAIDRFLGTAHAHGLPTGQQTPAGETLYEHYFWQVPFAAGDCHRNIPQMLGWGGVIVALFPNGMTGIRVAKSMGDAPGGWSVDALAHMAHAARGFCG